MPTMRGILQSGYYVGKVLIAASYSLAYLRWRIWKAKHVFKAELARSGIPSDVARTLANTYDTQNKQVVGSLIDLASSRRKHTRPI